MHGFLRHLLELTERSWFCSDWEPYLIGCGSLGEDILRRRTLAAADVDGGVVLILKCNCGVGFRALLCGAGISP